MRTLQPVIDTKNPNEVGYFSAEFVTQGRRVASVKFARGFVQVPIERVQPLSTRQAKKREAKVTADLSEEKWQEVERITGKSRDAFRALAACNGLSVKEAYKALKE